MQVLSALLNIMFLAPMGVFQLELPYLRKYNAPSILMRTPILKIKK